MVCQLAADWGRLGPPGADWGRLVVDLMLVACAALGAGPSVRGRRYGGALGTAAPRVGLSASAAGSTASNGSV